MSDNETYFRDQIFSRPILRLFLIPNIFETDTETFFRDRQRYSQKVEKSLDTEKSRDEMSHSGREGGGGGGGGGGEREKLKKGLVRFFSYNLNIFTPVPCAPSHAFCSLSSAKPGE